MDRDLSQQPPSSNDKGYQTLASVTCMNLDSSPATDYFAYEPLSCNTDNFENTCLDMSQQIYDSTGAFDAVETLSTTINLEHSLPSTQHQQTNLDYITFSSLGSRDSLLTADGPLTSTTFMSPTPISDHEGPHDLAFESSTYPSDTAAERRKDRRRSQNRVAQRAFRARKEKTIKQGMVMLNELQDHLAHLQGANAGLSETVDSLGAQLLRVQRENTVLKQWKLSVIVTSNSLTEDDDDYNKPYNAPEGV